MFREKFSRRLRELRHSRGLSQEQLAKLVNSSTNAIGMYETGKRMPREEILEKMYEYFGVSLDYLFGFNDDPNPYKEKDIDVYEIVKNEKEFLKDTEDKVLFKKGDFAVRVNEQISEYLSPFYFLNDVLVFEKKVYRKNAISLIKRAKKIYIGKLSKSGNHYIVDFLNPVFESKKIQAKDSELLGVLSGMIRIIER
jgi:transcriptional regulator with XRE-family HTH domain